MSSTEAQMNWMKANHPEIAKEFAAHIPDKKALPEVKAEKPHHSGKGTRARLNTAAEKHMFGSQYSK